MCIRDRTTIGPTEREFTLVAELLFSRLMAPNPLPGRILSLIHILRRNEFTGCRMLGMKLMDTDLQDVSFAACNAQLLRCWTSQLKAVRFEHCNFREASFDGTDLSGVVFYKCDLSQADLRNTKLKGTDLRGSTITGMQVLGKDLAGVIIDPGQALEFIPVSYTHLIKIIRFCQDCIFRFYMAVATSLGLRPKPPPMATLQSPCSDFYGTMVTLPTMMSAGYAAPKHLSLIHI